MQCKICSVTFSKFSNLRKHAKQFHAEELEQIAPLKKYRCVTMCNECSKPFSKRSNLVQHVKKFHPDKKDYLISPKVYNYKCEQCNKHFSHLRNFKTHQKSHPETYVIKTKTDLKCPLCDYENSSKLQLHSHFLCVHDITCNFDTIQFNSLDEFYEWKSLFEKQSNSYFVNQHGTYSSQTYTKTVYVCHRTGYYKKRGNNLRRLKVQASNKINGYCPAEMSVKFFKREKVCEVKYLATHVGHDVNDLRHLSLTKLERQQLAEKIAAHVPFSHILNDIRDSLYNDLQRIHLLTKKDLYNIKQAYNLNNDSARHKDDALGIDSWVKDLGDSVLFYKPQDCTCDRYPNLRKEDFILIFMNECQTDMLLNYGNDCICVDWTYGFNPYNFELTTILVLDDLREGFPCSFMISNRSDEEVMCIYFHHIWEALGQKVQPHVFMSDLAPAYYNAWLKVMLPATFKLFCSWHLDRAWRENLSKIDPGDKQAEVYKGLHTLLQEKDKEAFVTMIQNFITYLLSDAQTREFGNYFKQFYLNNYESWAYSYRLHSGLDTNMQIELMHKTIEHIYLHGNVVKRLDKAFYALMVFVRDKLFERLVVLPEGNISSKIQMLKSRHTISEMMNTAIIICSENSWQVPSTSTYETYTIEEKVSNCECKLLCPDCDVCLHKYVCTCLDSSIKWNMCKHIHLICKFQKEVYRSSSIETMELAGANSNDLIITEEVEEKGNEELKVEEVLSQTNSKHQVNVEGHFKAEKEKLLSQFMEIISNVVSFEQLQIVEEAIALLPATLAAIDGTSASTLVAKDNKKSEIPTKISKVTKIS